MPPCLACREFETDGGNGEVFKGRTQRNFTFMQQHALLPAQRHGSRVVGKPHPGAVAADIFKEKFAGTPLDSGVPARNPGILHDELRFAIAPQKIGSSVGTNAAWASRQDNAMAADEAAGWAKEEATKLAGMVRNSDSTSFCHSIWCTTQASLRPRMSMAPRQRDRTRLPSASCWMTPSLARIWSGPDKSLRRDARLTASPKQSPSCSTISPRAMPT